MQNNFGVVIVTGLGEEFFTAISTSPPGQCLGTAGRADGMLFILAKLVMQWNEN